MMNRESWMAAMGNLYCWDIDFDRFSITFCCPVFVILGTFFDGPVKIRTRGGLEPNGVYELRV